MPPYGVPRVSLNFVGFPPSSSSHSKSEAPSRRVLVDLPESSKSRNVTMYDLVAQVKRDHLSDDDGIDPKLCTFYTSDYAAISSQTSCGVLRDGEPVIVACFGGTSAKSSSSKDKAKEKESVRKDKDYDDRDRAHDK